MTIEEKEMTNETSKIVKINYLTNIKGEKVYSQIANDNTITGARNRLALKIRYDINRWKRLMDINTMDIKGQKSAADNKWPDKVSTAAPGWFDFRTTPIFTDKKLYWTRGSQNLGVQLLINMILNLKQLIQL